MCVLHRLSDEETIGRILREKDITIKEDDHKKLKYYTVKVKGKFECKCRRKWTSHKTTIKIDLYRKRLTKTYKQRCKRCRKWVVPFFNLEDVIDKVIIKYCERRESADSGDAGSDSTLVDSNIAKGNPRRPHEQALCERCEELGRPCW